MVNADFTHDPITVPEIQNSTLHDRDGFLDAMPRHEKLAG